MGHGFSRPMGRAAHPRRRARLSRSNAVRVLVEFIRPDQSDQADQADQAHTAART